MNVMNFYYYYLYYYYYIIMLTDPCNKEVWFEVLKLPRDSWETEIQCTIKFHGENESSEVILN